MKKTFGCNSVADLYFLMILLVAPLYFEDGFDNILSAKTFFIWVSIILCSALSILFIIKWIINIIHSHNALISIKNTIKDFCHSLNIMDIFVATFGIVCVVSSFLSEYSREAFSGEMAWNVGGRMLFMLCLLYFVFSRFMKSSFKGFMGMMAGGTIAMILAILNDLWIDPLNILTADENWRDHFTSTIGNIDQFSGYLSIIIPVMVVMFVISENGFKKTAAAIVLFFSYLNMFLTHADSVYVGVGISYLFIIAFCLKKPGRYMGLLINGILFGVSGFAARVIILYRPEIRLDDISPILLAHNVHVIVGGTCFALLLLYMFLDLKLTQERIEAIFKKLFWIYVVVAIVAVIGVIIVSAMNFDMYFLNRRGLLWYIAVYTFSDADMPQQIIGIGPGCVDTISENFYFEIQEAYGGDFYFLENLHNDVLEYLVTTGILGAISYLGIYICVIVDYIRTIFKNMQISPNKLFAMVGIIGYIAQSILNGPHPLLTAMFFVLLTIYRGETLNENV